MHLVKRFKGFSFLYFAPQHLQPIAEAAHHKSETGKGQPVDQQNMEHAGIDRTTTSDHRLRMLRAEKPDREINQRNVERPEDREHGSENRSLSTVGETAQDQIADIDEPQHQS